MNGTKKLYYEEPYLAQFCAKVLSCTPLPDGRFAVVLDQTAFYPEGGGQPADHGSLGGAYVLDAREENGTVVHITASPVRVGETVQGDVDWMRRFDHMQQHTGEHLLSGVIKSQFGYDNVGFHIGPDVVRVDVSGPLSCQDVQEIEQAANWVIWQNGPVQVLWPTPEELADMPYRSKKEIQGPVRIIDAAGADLCACCGTHVARCAEVGAVKVLSAQNYKGGTRLSIVCGMRALRDYTAKCENASKISNLLSAKVNEIAPAVEHLQNEAEDLKMRIARLETELFDCRAQQMAGNQQPVVFEENLRPDSLRRLCTALGRVCPGVCAAFSGNDEEGYSYALYDKDGDVSEFNRSMNATLNGRGGGRGELAQGTVHASRAAIEAYFQAL
ncbi:alanyl-tRNA editing protein [uncultured Ruthenibacterium sp.]|uniref:alanyl-tRNA editing protein n=1 Tax=uncultured Ruthenibacterium sp. TaxID=1905347 RepID=UPI00349E6D08